MRDEANAWEYTRKEEMRMARDDTIVSIWMFYKWKERMEELRASVPETDITVDSVKEISREVALYASQHRAQIIADWESTR